MDIFEGQAKLDNAKKIAKPKRGCKKCNGLGYLEFQPTIRGRAKSLFGPLSRVLCSCVKVRDE